MANNRIRTTALDFDEIKGNLKEYLRGQQKFSDYDFEGSGLAILLDVLAYNTHYNALYTNLAVNEAFLDSASKRDSVVSKAKEIGYVPQSARSARATVKVVLTGSVEPTLEIPQYSKFTAKVDQTSYTFYSTGTALAYLASGQHTFLNVELVEGTLLDYSFTADGVQNIFTIPNAGIDTTTLKVLVQPNPESSAFETYIQSTTVMDVDGNSLVYFLKETDKGFHQLEFGNGVIGKALAAGSRITCKYMVSSQDAANTARTFTYAGGPIDGTTAYVTTLSAAAGGAPPESIDDIKWNAPRAFAAQNRCVTLDDFRTVINNLYPHAASINVWGGEQNTPPTYGDVFISIKPDTGEILGAQEKEYILNEVLESRRVVTIHPKIVDPTYIHVELNTSFYYEPSETTRTAASIKALVGDAIANYNDTVLSKFGGILKYSALSRAIDEAEESIKSSISTIKLYFSLDPIYNKSTSYVADIGNPIYNSGVAEESVVSTGVRLLNVVPTVYFDDLPVENSGVGKLRMFARKGLTKQYLKNGAAVGTVNYDTGVVTFDNLVITGVVGSEFLLTIKPQSNDVVSARNKIVTIRRANTTITPVIEALADKYKFTSSRN